MCYVALGEAIMDGAGMEEERLRAPARAVSCGGGNEAEDDGEAGKADWESLRLEAEIRANLKGLGYEI